MADIFDLFKKIEKKAPVSAEPVSFILCGLGIPGKEYASTRHNAGFMTLDYIADKHNVRIDRAKFKALYGEITLSGKRGLLFEPMAYMNNSGEAVRVAAAFYKISPESIIVICDDIALAPGKIRVRKKGSDGGHNGLKSIIYHLNSDSFPRIRMGVGAKPHPDYDLAAWVTGEIKGDDKTALDSAIDRVYNNIELIINGEYDKAMNILN